MNKCVKITIIGPFPTNFLQTFIQKHARSFELEGLAEKVTSEQATVVACGNKDSVEAFVDAIYKGNKSFTADSVEVIPFVKEKDYRGIFRVIE